MLHCRRDDSQGNEDQDNDQIQSVAIQKLHAVEGVEIILFPLCKFLRQAESGETKQINQMITVTEGIMLSGLNALQFRIIGHLRIEFLILVNVIFVLGLRRILAGRQLLLMLRL